MELDTKIKWAFLIFSILQCTISGCQISHNHCYTDVFCSDKYPRHLNIIEFDENRECNNNVLNRNGYLVVPVRFKIESRYAVSSIFEQSFMIDNKKVIVSLDMSNCNLQISPDLIMMENLKMLNLSNNNLSVAKLYNEVELISLENIDLSHNYINFIDVDDHYFVYKTVKELNISNNLLTHIPGGIFDPFRDLEYLDLSHNYIASINHITFDGLRNVKYLYLSYNNISDINVSLFRFSNLEELYLNNNNIESISTQDFETLQNLRTLNLDLNKIKRLEQDIFSNMKSLITLKLKNNFISDIHKDVFTSTNNLKTIDLSNNLIVNLPKDLFRNKNISSFSITGNNLKGTISKGIFEGLQLITELDISYQALMVIEDFAFLGLGKLKMLLLNNNEIRAISERSFNTLVTLQTLDLSNNQIFSISFNKADLISLEILYLNNNFIRQVKHEHLQGLNRLRVLDVSNNNITKLGITAFRNVETIEILKLYKNPISGALLSNSFDGLHLIPALDLSYTSITSIQNGSFSGLVQLQELNVSRSSVNKVEYNAFMYTGNIKIIDLSFNQITDFYVNGDDLKNLTSLYLNNNAILQISKFYFSHMTILSKLILSYNFIQSIDDNCFADQSDLCLLDLSFNDNLKFNTSVINNLKNLEIIMLSGIKSTGNFKNFDTVPIRKLELSYLGIRNISLMYLNSLPHLTNLVMSNNNISKIEFSAFKKLSSLEWLDLSFNKIYFIQPGSFKDNALLKNLNLSHNSLSTLNFGTFRGLVSLNLLDISYNSIHDIRRERFYDTPNLRILIADYNRIEEVNPGFLDRQNLDLFSIGHNPLSCENIVDLKSYSNIKISAVNIDENSADNIDGIVCNINNYNKNPQIERYVNSTLSEKLLVNIRDILLNFSETRGSNILTERDNNDLLKDSIKELNKHATDHTLELKDIKTEVVYGLNGTYSLLERILKVMLGFGISQNRLIGDSSTNMMSNKENVTNFASNTNVVGNHSKLDALVSDVNQMKQELLYMETVISEIDRKISLGRTLYAPSISEKLNKSYHEDIATNNNEKSFIFMEICVSMILLMLVCFFLYKFYETKILKYSRSLSTRNITDVMDNSNL